MLLGSWWKNLSVRATSQSGGHTIFILYAVLFGNPPQSKVAFEYVNIGKEERILAELWVAPGATQGPRSQSLKPQHWQAVAVQVNQKLICTMVAFTHPSHFPPFTSWGRKENPRNCSCWRIGESTAALDSPPRYSMQFFCTALSQRKQCVGAAEHHGTPGQDYAQGLHQNLAMMLIP